MLGLGERQLHLFRQGAGEVIAPQRDVAVPDLLAVRNQQRRVVGPHVEQQRVIFLFVGRGAPRHVTELVVAQKVIQRQGSDLHQIDFDLARQKRRQMLLNLIALHGEQAHLGIEHEAALFDAAAQRLIVPDDFFESEGNLLAGFVFDDLAHFAGFDGRKLNEAGQGGLAGNADRHAVPLERISRQKCVEGQRDQLFGIRVGLA